MKRKLAWLAAVLLLLLTACGEQGTGAHLMKRISPKGYDCYLYIPLAWTDDTTDAEKNGLAAHLTDENGTATFAVTVEEYEFYEESEDFWMYWLSEDWWRDFWQTETKSSWNVLALEETTLNNSTAQKCVYTEGDTQTVEIVVMRYHSLYRVTMRETPTAADHSADFDEILGAFLWR